VQWAPDHNSEQQMQRAWNIFPLLMERKLMLAAISLCAANDSITGKFQVMQPEFKFSDYFLHWNVYEKNVDCF